MVGETAARGMKIVVPSTKRSHKSFQIPYVDVGNLRELIYPRYELRFTDGESLIRTKSGKHSRLQARFANCLVMPKIIGGVVGCTYNFNAKLLENRLRRKPS